MYVSLSAITIASQLNSYVCQTAAVLIEGPLPLWAMLVDDDDDAY